jgi:hypothetical protein
VCFASTSIIRMSLFGRYSLFQDELSVGVILVSKPYCDFTVSTRSSPYIGQLLFYKHKPIRYDLKKNSFTLILNSEFINASFLDKKKVSFSTSKIQKGMIEHSRHYLAIMLVISLHSYFRCYGATHC